MVDPAGHLHGLPVGGVDEDTGATAPGGQVNLGRTIAAGLEGSKAVSIWLGLEPDNLAAAEHRMDLAQQYAAVVIPAGFTASLLAVDRPTSGSSTPVGEADTERSRARIGQQFDRHSRPRDARRPLAVCADGIVDVRQQPWGDAVKSLAVVPVGYDDTE